PYIPGSQKLTPPSSANDAAGVAATAASAKVPASKPDFARASAPVDAMCEIRAIGPIVTPVTRAISPGYATPQGIQSPSRFTDCILTPGVRRRYAQLDRMRASIEICLQVWRKGHNRRGGTIVSEPAHRLRRAGAASPTGFRQTRRGTRR